MRRRDERGAVAIIVAILLAVLLGFAALSLDVGHLLSVRGELQNGADAAALAGAKRLNGRNEQFELSGAKSDARLFARSHPTDRYDVEPRSIELGAWLPPAPDKSCGELGGALVGSAGPDGHQFCAIAGTTEEHAANINAVRVVTAREGAPAAAGGGGVELAFGAFVGRTEPAPVAAEAIAVTGGPCNQKCPELPIAIRAGCLYENGEIRCDANDVGPIYFIGLSPAPADSAGLTSLSDDISANANAACDILRTQDGCTPVTSGEQINVQDGNDWVAACDYGCPYQSYDANGTTGTGASGKNDKVCEVIRRKADTNCDGVVDDLDNDGRPDFRTQVPVIQFPGESATQCEGSYNKAAQIVGWATVSIVSARCETDQKLPFDTVPMTSICDDYARTHGDFSAKTCVAIQLYCNEKDDEPTRVGCGWFGTSPNQPMLVR